MYIGPGDEPKYGSIAVTIETPSADGRPGSEVSFLSTDTVTLTAVDGCAWWTLLGASGAAARADVAKSFRLTAKPPAAPNGRSTPLTMSVLAVGENGSTIVTLAQDGIDRIRQQYLDMGKDRTPRRSEFAEDFGEIRSHDGETWAIFTAGPQLMAWRGGYRGPLPVNRAYSTPRHNAAVSGAKNSQHIYGDAVDARSNRGDWYAKRNVVRDLGACIEPSDISTFNHVHGDWRKGCPAKWREKARREDRRAVQRPRLPSLVRSAYASLGALLPGPNATFSNGYSPGSGSSRRRLVAGGVGFVIAWLAYDVWKARHPSPAPLGPLSFGDWTLRNYTLRQLDLNDGLPATSRFLIDSLILENAYLRWRRTQALPDLCEDYGDYYIELALAVSQLDDEHAVPALAGAVDAAPAVATALASYGDPAVRPALAALRDPLDRDGGAYALGRLIEGRRAHGVSISRWNLWRIRRALVRIATGDDDSAIRGTAIRSLGELDPNARLRGLMDRLAQDPRVRPDVDAVRAAWERR